MFKLIILLYINCFFTDFEKALIVKKLQEIGFAYPILSWFKSFPSQKIQFFKYKNIMSSVINVISGVPQGDHLLYLIYL